MTIGKPDHFSCLPLTNIVNIRVIDYRVDPRLRNYEFDRLGGPATTTKRRPPTITPEGFRGVLRIAQQSSQQTSRIL
ncbi:hypothetical protein FEZ60_27090 [Rhodococcus sp. MS16]|uniref:hypothetical protein n=1 Tax=Rhodococcus sp. MS16 TaxID=2579941 RepID=UPI00156293D9|nr:hypothetical protein [Rhodococcus sp. MS16]NRI69191.1 hypothetical protein [Rhodococcus sp. MS16]